MIELKTDKDFRENYKILIGSILPRPIAVVSTLNHNGSFNLAPFSFFTGVSASPMIIAFCPMTRSSDGQKKDTLINIEREKEFVINFCTEKIADQVNLCSQEIPYGEDEFKLSGLTPLKSKTIRAPRMAESPIQFECILRDILSYGNTIGSGSLITGEVKLIHIDETLYDQGRISTDLFNPIGRGAGNDWILTDHRIEKNRLMKVQIQK